MASITAWRTAAQYLLGKMFGGQRDLYKVFGYDKAITYQKAMMRYRRQDIASRIIDAPANALWANPPELISKDEAWNKAWKEVLKRNVWDAVMRVDKMAGMGDFALLLIGLDQTSKLDQPANLQKDRKLLYFQPYSSAQVTIKKLVDNVGSPLYLKPELYTIKPSFDTTAVQTGAAALFGKAAQSLTNFDVHQSRTIHVLENYLTDEVFGNPRMERVWNLLDDLLKVAGGTAETFWLTSNRGMHVDVDKEMELTPEDEKDLTDEMEEYVHQLRRVIRTRGVKVTNLGSDVPDPMNTFNMLMAMMSGATGIPKRILLGSEAGQLASTEDRNNWAERIEERRSGFAEPVIIKPLVQTLTEAGVLPEMKDELEIKWPDAFRLSPLERAQTSAQRARSAANLSKAMDTKSDLLTTEEARDILELEGKAPPKAPDESGDEGGAAAKPKKEESTQENK